MEDRSIAWMIRGGVRTETPDQRHQRLHLAALAAEAPQRHDQPWAGRASAWLERLAPPFRGVRSGSAAARTSDCCPAWTLTPPETR